MIDFRKTIRLYHDYVMPSYKKIPVVMERGRNLRLTDAEGREYLDFFSGFAVSAAGHCHKRVVEAIKRQAERLIHVPNTYYHEGQARLAEKIIRHAFPGKVFFGNSGAEAVEGAIKLARRWGSPDRFEIIAMANSFHGRTMGALSATGQPKFHEGVGPLLPGFVHVPLNDLEAVERAVTPRTVAVMLELIQGEGGVHAASSTYVKHLRELCSARNLLLIFDEIQTGMGRTGKMFCFKHYGVEPDIMTLAKALGGGFPIGALVGNAKVADLFQPGTHASTFGGSPLACAAALAVFEALEKEGLVQNAFIAGSYLERKLGELKRNFDCVKETRGMGLLRGIELDRSAQDVIDSCLEQGLIVNVTQDRVVRMAPPLTVQEKDIDLAMGILNEALKKHERNSKETVESHGNKETAR